MGCATSSASEPDQQSSKAATSPSNHAAPVKLPAAAVATPEASRTDVKPVEVKAVVEANAAAAAKPTSVVVEARPTTTTMVVPKAAPEEPPLAVNPGIHTNKDGAVARVRRQAQGSEAMRNQLRKMVVVDPTKGDKSTGQVSDSENEDLSTNEPPRLVGAGWTKPQEITDAICEALKRNFVFKGIPEGQLLEVVDRMYGVCFKAGSTVLQQGALPSNEDCMYYLQLGEAEVVISGGADSKAHGEERKVEGHNVRILQKPGWVFGDVALLFSSSRTASVVAKTNITVWAMDRKTFLKFVMINAQGARALRFLRKLPLLKGLSDNDLIRAASRMPQRVYQDGQALIKYGERADELYLVRYGKVRVLRPVGEGKSIEVAVLGRGQFVGERAVINDKLRSADCVAQGTVQVVVMKKRDFAELDNPLLAWMLDYDCVATVLKFLPSTKTLKQEQLEQLLDRFDQREEKIKDDVVIKQGDLLDKLFVVKLGTVAILENGRPVADTSSFVREVGGFAFFGDAALQQPFKSQYEVVVTSESAQILTLPKRQLDSFLGLDQGLGTPEQQLAALKKIKALALVNDAELKAILKVAEETSYPPGAVVAAANSSVTNKVFLVKAGEVILVAADLPLPSQGEVDVRRLAECGRLQYGAVINDKAITSPVTASLEASIVAAPPTGCVLLSFTTGDVERILGGRAANRPCSAGQVVAIAKVKFTDLEFHRIIGTGQFGMVRVVRNIRNNEVYALKAMHKAPITEPKQIEHVINERRILEEVVNHPFHVQLKAAYQDQRNLYLLQEWVAGGELFHHLDVEGAFDDATSCFFAANVLLALEYLHNKGIVYRDLKPENLLLDTQGYLKMADFGFAKYVGADKTHTICGTPDYQAPEVIMRRGTNKAADYWGLGVLIFEMLVGDPPFKSLNGDPWDTFRRALSGRFYVPNFITDNAADLIFKLLQVNPDKRLGSGPGGASDIKKHKWFSRIDWKQLEAKKIPAPLRPKVRNPLDTSNFDNFDNADVEAPPVPPARSDRTAPQWELWDWLEGTGP